VSETVHQIAPAANLSDALSRAQGRAHAVRANAVNADDPKDPYVYVYASAEAVITEARAALSAEKISVFPVSSLIVPPPANEKGSPLRRTTWRVSFGAEHLEHVREWPIVAQGRTSDKATATADTSSLAYFLRDLLLLPRVEPGMEMDARPTPKTAVAPSSSASSSPATSDGRTQAPPPERVAGLRKECALRELDGVRSRVKALVKQLPPDMKQAAWDEFNAVKNSREAARLLPELGARIEAVLVASAAPATANGSPT